MNELDTITYIPKKLPRTKKIHGRLLKAAKFLAGLSSKPLGLNGEAAKMFPTTMQHPTKRPVQRTAAGNPWLSINLETMIG
jgi:hypothetical protein